jgi:hypothetical protein
MLESMPLIRSAPAMQNRIFGAEHAAEDIVVDPDDLTGLTRGATVSVETIDE